jgi:hypothetical protein
LNLLIQNREEVSLSDQLAEQVVDFLVLGHGMARLVAQLRIGEHHRVERLLLGRGMGLQLLAQLLEQLPPLLVLARRILDPRDEVAVPVVVGFQVGVDLRVGHGSVSFPTRTGSPLSGCSAPEPRRG